MLVYQPPNLPVAFLGFGPVTYALQLDYERLLRIVGHVTAQEIELMADRFTRAGDARDVLAARDSLVRMLRL